jgi:DNA repair exonuclease SbcCD ATPase subunit
MFKIDKVKNLFNCDDCNQLLFEPVTLPCGNSVCKRHLNPFPNSFKCSICHNEHPVPNEGFVISKRIQIALDIQLYNLKLDPKVDQCKTKLEELKNIAAELEKLTLNPEDYLYEYFEEIKSKVDLRRETLKANIDEFSDELIESIEVTKAYHFTLSKQINKQTTQIIQSQNELNNLIAQFDTFEINYNKIENIETCIASLKQKFNKLLVQYKEALLEEKNYAFSYDAGNIGKIFGSFQINRDTKLVII